MDKSNGPIESSHSGAGERRLWGGRFGEGPAPTLEELNRSLPVDRRLWREDIRGSLAWVEALQGAGVLGRSEAEALQGGLRRVEERLSSGAPEVASDEDIHSLVERLLYEEVGAVAGKLHAGRSRNDQVGTDFRLWALDAVARLDAELLGLQSALLDQAERHIDTLIPGYTHLRRAQPVRLAHWLLAHFWAVQRDRGRLADALPRISVMPLGSGAIAGTAFAVDRSKLADTLGFQDISPNSIDAVGDRDWVAEVVFAAALVAVHLSRLAEDLIVFSTEEFGFIILPERYTTGSSLLPQKRNPDGLELARGKTAWMIGAVSSVLALLKGLPSGYQKDLQEDKSLLFETLDCLFLILPATRETVLGLDFDREMLSAAVDDFSLLATDIADSLVRQGVPFREAHGAVGRLLRRSEELGVPPMALSEQIRAEIHPLFSKLTPWPTAESSVQARAVPGGTAREAVLAQIRDARRVTGRP